MTILVVTVTPSRVNLRCSDAYDMSMIHPGGGLQAKLEPTLSLQVGL